VIAEPLIFQVFSTRTCAVIQSGLQGQRWPRSPRGDDFPRRCVRLSQNWCAHWYRFASVRPGVVSTHPRKVRWDGRTGDACSLFDRAAGCAGDRRYHTGCTCHLRNEGRPWISQPARQVRRMGGARPRLWEPANYTLHPGTLKSRRRRCSQTWQGD
jgi:hypothetical protein